MTKSFAPAVLFVAVFSLMSAVSGPCLAEEADGAAPVPVSAQPNPQLDAAYARMQAISEDFNEVSGQLVAKANPSCPRCLAIVKQFEGEYGGLSAEYNNAVTRIDGENAQAMFVSAATNYNNKMASLIDRYQKMAAGGRPDSLCGRCTRSEK